MPAAVKRVILPRFCSFSRIGLQKVKGQISILFTWTGETYIDDTVPHCQLRHVYYRNTIGSPLDMSAELTKQETWSLLGLSAGCIAIIANTFQGDGEPLIASLSFSGLAFAASYSMIRWLGPVFVKAGLKGKDMSKVKKVEMYV